MSRGLFLLLLLPLALFLAEDVEFCTDKDESVATEYIKTNRLGGRFRVHGWRWHTMSVIRELRLLQTLVSSSGKTEEVTQGFDHVVGFNMKGLNRVESKLFFPWLKEKLDLIPDEGAKQAFQRVLKTATKQQEVLKEKAQDMVSSSREESSIQAKFMLCAHKRNTQTNALATQATTEDLSLLVTTMVSTLEEIARIQTTYLIPAIATLVPEPEQVSFNSKVLRNMGILDSRTYLVGMYEAIQGDTEEIELFEEEIPFIPRYMIPRWKRLLYDPKTSVLSHQGETTRQ